MKAIYQNNANGGGIYRIINLVNEKVYYGSTSRFNRRYASHKATLEAGTHVNTYLLNEYKKYGSDNFLFEVIEIINGNEKERLIIEQKYLDRFYDKQKKCFNLRSDAASSRAGVKQRKPTDHFTDGRCKSPNEETLKKRAERIREAKSSVEQKEKAREHAYRLWKDHKADITIVHIETGEEVYVDMSLKRFAEIKGLSYKSLHLLAKGKTKSCGGWFLKGKPPVYVSKKGQIRKPLTEERRQKIAILAKGTRYEGIKIISPGGNVLELPNNIKRFCQDNNIHYSTFLKLIKRECNSCNGWKIS